MKKTLKIETVHECNSCLGCKTLHPLVSAIDLSQANLTERSIKFSFYTLLLIENDCNEFIYGRKYYDYSNATVLFLSPGQSIQLDESKPFPQKGWLLAFHPHLICGTSLGMSIDHYTFFSYHTEEALHLSQREKTKAIECLRSIEQELQQSIDKHSRTIISRYIELLLDYCSRFYERQFITRNEANKQVLNQLETVWEEYVQSGKLRSKNLPSTAYCADLLQLSPHYLSDLLKFETGKTISEHFQLKRIATAQKLLLTGGHTIRFIAEELGFPSVTYFSKLFQRMTGVAPSEYSPS